MLPADWEQRLVDLNVAELSDADLAWADYVFVSAMIVQRDVGPRGDRPLQGAGRTWSPAARSSPASTPTSPRSTTSC